MNFYCILWLLLFWSCFLFISKRMVLHKKRGLGMCRKVLIFASAVGLSGAGKVQSQSLRLLGCAPEQACYKTPRCPEHPWTVGCPPGPFLSITWCLFSKQALMEKYQDWYYKWKETSSCLIPGQNLKLHQSFLRYLLKVEILKPLLCGLEFWWLRIFTWDRCHYGLPTCHT